MIVRVRAPDPTPGYWWSAYRALFAALASIGGRHTGTPDRAWFAVWEGHGFDTATTHVAWRDPPFNEDTRQQREVERARLREEDERRNDAIRAAEGGFPRFNLPNRTYYLLSGPVSAVAELRYPDSLTEWRNPDLFWPDDRRWFVATDVDFWSLYVGGDDFIAELSNSLPTSTELVTIDRQLETED